MTKNYNALNFKRMYGKKWNFKERMRLNRQPHTDEISNTWTSSLEQHLYKV